MVGFFASQRRGAVSCALLTGACAALAPTAGRAETAQALRFADAAMITHWSLPRQSEAVGRLPEPTFVTPSAAGPAAPPLKAWEERPAAAAASSTPAQQTLGLQFAAVEDLSTRSFTLSDRLQPAGTPSDIKRLEIAFHLLNAADAISTVACLQRDDCQEENPIYGKRPKAAVVIGAKALTSGVHYWVMRTLLPDYPGMARAFGWFSVTVQGTVVGLNMTQLF